MSHKELEKHLTGALQRLEETAEKIIKTRGYTRDVEKIRILSELIKEQNINENIGHSTRSVR